jgi:hypothetical protein
MGQALTDPFMKLHFDWVVRVLAEAARLRDAGRLEYAFLEAAVRLMQPKTLKDLSGVSGVLWRGQ